jgi:hypothetical protein
LPVIAALVIVAAMPLARATTADVTSPRFIDQGRPKGGAELAMTATIFLSIKQN